jgi:hypothetical protein
VSDVKLPPRPQPDTGLPRPPAAPLDNSWGTSHRRGTDRTSTPPAPPGGQGTTLEWISRSWKAIPQVALFIFVILAGFATLKDWGIGWMRVWWLWLVAGGLSLLAGLAVWSSEGMEAGADWFKYGGSWVKTYELTEVNLEKSWGSDRLELKDVDGHDLSIKMLNIQINPDLWNLVYNGILHSVHYGGAVANERAVVRLRLDEPRSASAADDQRG